MPCDFFLKITEDKYNYYIAIDVNERERARYLSCPGRMWNRLTKEWVYPRSPMAYRAICDEFGEYPEKLARITPPDVGDAGARPLQNTVLPASVKISLPLAPVAPVASPSSPPSAAPVVAASVAQPAPAADANMPKQPPPVPTDAAGTVLKFPAPALKPEDVIELLNTQTRAMQHLNDRLAAIENTLAKLPAQPSPGATEIADTLRPLLARLEEKLERKNTPSPNDGDAMRLEAEWLGRVIAEGAGNNPRIKDICDRWNLVRDFYPVTNDIDALLCQRLRELLNDNGSVHKNLHRLCDDAFEARVLDKECIGFLNAFRKNRIKITPKAREGWHGQMLRYLHALTAFALVWPLLDEMDGVHVPARAAAASARITATPAPASSPGDFENEDADPA